MLHVHGTSKAHAAVLAHLQFMLLYHSAEKEIQPSKTPSRIKFSIHHAKVTAGKGYACAGREASGSSSAPRRYYEVHPQPGSGVACAAG
jgi:hypothetical protein